MQVGKGRIVCCNCSGHVVENYLHPSGSNNYCCQRLRKNLCSRNLLATNGRIRRTKHRENIAGAKFLKRCEKLSENHKFIGKVLDYLQSLKANILYSCTAEAQPGKCLTPLLCAYSAAVFTNMMFKNYEKLTSVRSLLVFKRAIAACKVMFQR